MAIWPLMERELRVALRRRQRVLPPWGIAIYCCFMTGFLLLHASREWPGQGASSWLLHLWLLKMAAIVILMVPFTNAGVFAEERRHQTLGLLFVTGLKPGEIVLGKGLGSALFGFYGLGAIFPLFAVDFLVGGMAWSHCLATMVCLLALFGFVWSASTSAWRIHERSGARVSSPAARETPAGR